MFNNSSNLSKMESWTIIRSRLLVHQKLPSTFIESVMGKLMIINDTDTKVLTENRLDESINW